MVENPRVEQILIRKNREYFGKSKNFKQNLSNKYESNCMAGKFLTTELKVISLANLA